ncbi:MAG: dihydropteroate synthase [Candidatus Saccharicenans sp.]
MSCDLQEDEFLQVALEEYPGRPLINSAKAKEENLRSRLNLLRRHGGLLIVLAMEEEIPETAEQRIKVIEKALSLIKEAGFNPDRIFFDPLVLPFGARND